VFGAAGEFQGYIGIGSDLTNQVEAEDRANLANERLAAAVEALSEPFVLWDSEDRLAIGNRRFREINALIGDKVRPGTLFKDFARALADQHLVPAAAGQEDDWFAERLEHHRNPKAPFELERQDGTWLMIRDQRLPDGSTATISADITDIKIAEARLAESQERFRDFAEVAADWFWEQDADLRFTNVTADNMAVTGMKQEDHYGKTRRETGLLDVTEAEMLAHERQLLNREAFSDFRFSRLRPDGEKVYISISGKPFFDAQGKFLGYRGAGGDITNRRIAEMALREGEERYRILTEQSLQGIGIIQDGCVAFANDAIAGLLGYKPEDMVGKPVTNFVMAEYHAMIDDRREARLRNEERPAQYDLQVRHRDGSAIWVEQLVQTILWNGRPAVQVAIVDLSQRKEAEKALVAAKEEAEIANRAKSEFLAHFSHELRTPLNAIIGFSEIMLHELFGPLGHERYTDYAGDIHHSGGHLLALISDILDLSRIEAGQVERDESVFDAGRAIAECVRLVQGRAGKKGVTINLRLPDAGPWIRADQRQIRQILLNLLSNAVKFTWPDSTVVLEAALEAGGGVAFSIIDCGEGIADADIKRVQEPFTRLGGAMTSSEEGTGLGLAITKRLAESHGGSLQLISKLGQGTTAMIRLPSDRVIAKAS
jgi:PAS domain S-box-containing protein